MVDLVCFMSGVSTERGLQAGSWSLKKTDCHKEGCDEKNNEDHFRNILLLAV